MDQAWKSINGFVVSFTSSFDQLKIKFYTEIKNKTKQNKTKRKSHPWKLSITIEKEYIPLLNWNRPFPSSPGPLFQTRVGVQPLIWKSFFILMQIKLIFTRKVVHLASFWKWGFLALGSGLLSAYRQVVQWIEALTFSSNWFWGSGFESPWSKFFVTLLFFLF